MISPLEIQDKTIRTPEWSYFQSILNDVFELIKPFPWITLNAKPSSINATKHIHILLADPQLNLSNPMVLQNIAGQTSLRWVSENHPMAPTLPNKKPAPYYSPIISIGYEDIMSTYSLPRESEEKDPEKRRIRSYDMDSRFKFLDSSIWHRYVPVYSGGHYVFKQRFREVILEIVQNHSDELYRTNAARAMLEFQLRMMRESYIFPV
ncbi:MAG: hypothetical protein KJT03_24365, partial [Verrucomicrobiae bacterium]|nr:hypothetical protein [Verrucomicrobiae bacterium]